MKLHKAMHNHIYQYINEGENQTGSSIYMYWSDMIRLNYGPEKNEFMKLCYNKAINSGVDWKYI